MSTEDSDLFKEAMKKEVNSFIEKKIFQIIPLKDKPSHKSLIPFVWSFKQKRNIIGDLIKYKARLYLHGEKQVKGIDYQNTYAPVVQLTIVRIMLILHMMNRQ